MTQVDSTMMYIAVSDERDRLKATNAELLAALELCADALQDHVQYDDGESLERTGYEVAVAAIAKAKE